jgi:hypothetical protein
VARSLVASALKPGHLSTISPYHLVYYRPLGMEIMTGSPALRLGCFTRTQLHASRISVYDSRSGVTFWLPLW